MKKFIFVLLSLLVLNNAVLGEVCIAKKHYVYNYYPGYCCWCCLEMLGRNQQIEVLKGLAKARSQDNDYVESRTIQVAPGVVAVEQIVTPKNYGPVAAVKQKLDSLKVKYKITYWDREHIKEAVNKNGCVIFLKSNSLMGGEHAVIITDYSTSFTYLDPNDCCYWRGSMDWFETYWAGVAIEILDALPPTVPFKK